jgi:hypothetical protein
MEKADPVMGTRVKVAADEDRTARSIPLGVAFVSIWAYALLAGLLALGTTRAIAAFIPPRPLRTQLQWATLPAVAILAGLTCETALMRVRSLIDLPTNDAKDL